ncbi:MAG TPA: hypothetical protein PLU97_01050, partial [Candidatus Cryptobacteroides sp.]|nr:hypothetical protein [Candidatus Cryptobacteroides sp.]
PFPRPHFRSSLASTPTSALAPFLCSSLRPFSPPYPLPPLFPFPLPPPSPPLNALGIEPTVGLRVSL